MKGYTRIKIDNPEKIFFTSDPHFFHERMIEICKRPFRGAEDMKEALIRNWNAVVPRDGSVFVLGDMFWKRGEIGGCERVMERLNGKKWLIAGNHDLFPRGDYLDMGFEDARGYLEISVGRQLAVLSHYPLLEWNGFYHGSWHLHGHVHGRGSHFSFRAMDVGVDANGFAPVPWREVARKLDAGFDIDMLAMAERGDTQRHRPFTFWNGERR